jgi:serine/threonine protein kinase
LSTSGEVKLTDFTLAQQRSHHGYHGMLGASTGYAAPEQLSGGQLSPRTDIYGLGALLLRMLDVARLTSAEGQQVLDAIDRAMAADPDARFDSVDAFLSALPGVAPDTRLVAHSSVPDLTRVARQDRPDVPKRSLSPWWAPVALCCALLVAAGGMLSHFTVHAQPARTTIPDLVGTQRASAELVVRSLGLHPHVIATYSSTVPAGEISSQNPRPGAAVPEPSGVTLVVSRGPAPVPVPDLHRLAQTAAISALRARGFRVVLQTSDSIFDPSGIVLDQSIPPGTVRIPGTTVTLTISQKPWWWIF